MVETTGELSQVRSVWFYIVQEGFARILWKAIEKTVDSGLKLDRNSE